MKRLLFVLAVMLCFPAITISQDLIVTDKGDSLNCKITKTKGDYIHFMFKYEDEIRNTLLPTYRVADYRKDFFSQPELPEKIARQEIGYSKFSFGATGGFSYLLGRISPNVPYFLKDYMKKLKTGYHVGANANFFISENIGFGAKYTLFKTKHEINNVVFYNEITDETAVGIIRDDITTHYIGPAFCTRFFSKNKQTVINSTISLGYIDYRNNAVQLNSFSMTGNTVGLVWDFNVDFKVGKQLAICLGLSTTLGSISSFRVNDGTYTHTINLDSQNSENISRLDLGAGLRMIL